MAIPLAVAVLVLATLAAPARAGAIRKCAMPDGTVAFTQMGCPGARSLGRYALPPPAVSSGGKESLQRQDFAEYRQGERFGPATGSPRRRQGMPPLAVAGGRQHRAARPTGPEPVAAEHGAAPHAVAVADPHPFVGRSLGVLAGWVASARAASLPAGPGHDGAGPAWTASSATRHARPGAHRGVGIGWN